MWPIGLGGWEGEAEPTRIAKNACRQPSRGILACQPALARSAHESTCSCRPLRLLLRNDVGLWRCTARELDDRRDGLLYCRCQHSCRRHQVSDGIPGATFPGPGLPGITLFLVRICTGQATTPLNGRAMPGKRPGHASAESCRMQNIPGGQPPRYRDGQVVSSRDQRPVSPAAHRPLSIDPHGCSYGCN